MDVYVLCVYYQNYLHYTTYTFTEVDIHRWSIFLVDLGQKKLVHVHDRSLSNAVQFDTHFMCCIV